MKIISIEKIDGWDGNVIPGNPVEGDLVRLTYSNGTIRERKYHVPADPVEVEYIFLHTDVSKGGIRNDGVDSVTVTMTFRQTKAVDSAILTQITGINRIISLRDTRSFEYDLLRVSVVDGVVTFDYSTTNRGATVHIDKEDVELKIGGKQIVLLGNATFQVYRDLTV